MLFGITLAPRPIFQESATWATVQFRRSAISLRMLFWSNGGGGGDSSFLDEKKDRSNVDEKRDDDGEEEEECR